MAEIFRIQLDANGEEITPEQIAANHQPLESVPSARAIDVTALNAELKAASESMNSEHHRATRRMDFKNQLSELANLDRTIQHLEAAGEKVPPSMRHRRATLNIDVQLSGEGLSEADVNDIAAQVNREF